MSEGGGDGAAAAEGVVVFADIEDREQESHAGTAGHDDQQNQYDGSVLFFVSVVGSILVEINQIQQKRQKIGGDTAERGLIRHQRQDVSEDGDDKETKAR